MLPLLRLMLVTRSVYLADKLGMMAQIGVRGEDLLSQDPPPRYVPISSHHHQDQICAENNCQFQSVGQIRTDACHSAIRRLYDTTVTTPNGPRQMTPEMIKAFASMCVGI